MASGIVGDGTLPIGRRVAQLRTRLGMSQQVFADRVGRSTSWVDKALGVAPTVLLDQNTRGESATTIAPALERVRAVLACYDTPIADGRSPTKELVTRIGYAWAAYAHAQHQQVLATLPDLLTEARHARPVAVPAGPEPAADLLGRVYRLAARLLVKLGEPELAWLAADRAIATSAGDPRRTALAVIPMAQALRALDRGRLAMTATITAVHRLAPHPSREPAPTDAALAGTLLVQAALAAAGNTNRQIAKHLCITVSTVEQHLTKIYRKLNVRSRSGLRRNQR
ncbi:LuxR C-terminal-related transcriptional regulator [Micromonospora zhanjiangensis]